MKYLFERLDTSQGHILILVLLMIGGVGTHCLGVTEYSREIIVGSFAALLVELKGTANGKGGGTT